MKYQQSEFFLSKLNVNEDNYLNGQRADYKKEFSQYELFFELSNTKDMSMTMKF
jgi:hypothetical protein